MSRLNHRTCQIGNGLAFLTASVPASLRRVLDFNMASMDVDSSSNISFLPASSLPTPPTIASYDEHRGMDTPLIIDNGTTHLRYGFSTSKEPYTGMNVVARYKERKYNRPLLLFGDAIDAESGAKGQARTPWEGDVLVNADALVCCFCLFILRDVDGELIRSGDVGKYIGLRVCASWHRCRHRGASSVDDRAVMFAALLSSEFVHFLFLVFG